MTTTDNSSIPGLDADDLRIAAVWNAPDSRLLTLAKAGGLDPQKDFRGADLRGWPLAGQDVRGVDFTGSDLRGTGIETAIQDETTILTDALLDPIRPRAKAKKIDRVADKGLFIGDASIELTFLADKIPTGDEATDGRDYAFSFGGCAVTAAFCFAKLGLEADLLTAQADDWGSRLFLDMAAKYALSVHGRAVRESSVSIVLPNNGQSAILRCRDDHYLHPVPPLDLTDFRVLLLDGEQADAAIHYARQCREAGIQTFLQATRMGPNTLDLLSYIDVAFVSERFCDQVKLDGGQMLDLLKTKQCRIGGVFLNDLGLNWYDQTGATKSLPAPAVPQNEIIDTNGTAAFFCGAYLYSYVSNPTADWQRHLTFGQAAAAHRVRFLGNEHGLPTLAEVTTALREFVASE